MFIQNWESRNDDDGNWVPAFGFLEDGERSLGW